MLVKKISRQRGWQNLWLQCDSKLVIDVCHVEFDCN
ncbi:hypothetical protein A2U01_0113587, partial [Trifolium medium]|nr:hypothetical protein [Trifolium medium]